MCPDSPDDCPPLMLDEGIELDDDIEALDRADNESDESMSTTTTTTLPGSEVMGVPISHKRMTLFSMIPIGGFVQPIMQPIVNYVPVDRVSELNQLGMLPTVTATPVESYPMMSNNTIRTADSYLGLNIQAREFRPQIVEGTPLWS